MKTARHKGQKIESNGSQKTWHCNAIGQHKKQQAVESFNAFECEHRTPYRVCTCLASFCFHQSLSDFILFDERNGQLAIESTNQHLSIWTSSGLSGLAQCNSCRG